MNVRVLLFGAFREYGSSIDLAVADGATAADVKAALGVSLAEKFPTFRESGLLSRSALGGAKLVFRDDEVIPLGEELAVLPPVCGG